jgi:hypothetical protein
MIEGNRGSRYRLETTESLSRPIQWQVVEEFETNASLPRVVDLTNTRHAAGFYRVVELP